MLSVFPTERLGLWWISSILKSLPGLIVASVPEMAVGTRKQCAVCGGLIQTSSGRYLALELTHWKFPNAMASILNSSITKCVCVEGVGGMVWPNCLCTWQHVALALTTDRQRMVGQAEALDPGMWDHIPCGYLPAMLCNLRQFFPSVKRSLDAYLTRMTNFFAVT